MFEEATQLSMVGHRAGGVVVSDGADCFLRAKALVLGDDGGAECRIVPNTEPHEAGADVALRGRGHDEVHRPRQTGPTA